MFNFDITRILASIPALVIALSVFSYAQALAATWLGDSTPRMAGRVTLSPASHLDVVGTVLMLLIGFGWPKPVPINPSNFEDPRRDMTLVTFAGPVMCLLVGFIFTCVFVILSVLDLLHSVGLTMMLQYIILYCIGIALFCLIPIPPLPGFNLVLPWLPVEWQMRYYQLGWFNLIFLLILINSPLLPRIIIPLQQNVFKVYFAVIGAVFGM